MAKIQIKLKKNLKDAGIPFIESQLIYAGKIFTVDNDNPMTQKQLEHYQDSIVILDAEEAKPETTELEPAKPKRSSKKSKNRSKTEVAEEPEQSADEEQIYPSDEAEEEIEDEPVSDEEATEEQEINEPDQV